MSSRLSLPPSARAAASPTGGGCLSGVLLPPLVVLTVGLFLAGLLSDVPAPAPAASFPAGTPDGVLSPVFTPEVDYWSRWILIWAAEAGVDPNLAATVMQIESCGDERARSVAGALGLFQVMPYHFASGEDPYDPSTNARRGLAYLRRALEAADGDPRLALAAYNGGIGVIGRHESAWPAETRRYAFWGSGIYAEAVSGAQVSLRLQEWLEAGGAGLCRQARRRLGLTGGE
jgi:soluble lytic murein transglycosylase-like protein